MGTLTLTPTLTLTLPLTRYLAGLIREDDLLQDARPWTNYSKDYRQMVQFCKGQAIDRSIDRTCLGCEGPSITEPCSARDV